MIYEKGEVIPNEVIGASYFAIVKALIKCDISKDKQGTLIITPLEPLGQTQSIICLESGGIYKPLYISKQPNVVNKFKDFNLEV